MGPDTIYTDITGNKYNVTGAHGRHGMRLVCQASGAIIYKTKKQLQSEGFVLEAKC